MVAVDLGDDEESLVYFADRNARGDDARAVGLEAEQTDHVSRWQANGGGSELALVDAEAREIFLRGADTAAVRVLGDVRHDVGELQRVAEVDVLLMDRSDGWRKTSMHMSPIAEARR